MATSSPLQLFSTDPNVQTQAALIQQRQALAQALLQQGMSPVETSNRSIGGVGYRVSPMEGLAKMLQAYVGRSGVEDATTQMGQLASQAYGNLLQRYQPGQSTYSPDQVNQAEDGSMNAGMGPPDPRKIASALAGQTPANQNVNPNNPMNIPAQILAQKNAGMMDDETFKALTSGYQATDATKAGLQGGMNPIATNRAAFVKSQTDPKIYGMQQAGLSPEQINQAIAGEAQKGASQTVRPEQSLYTFTGSGAPSLQAVAPDAGSNMQFQVGPGGAVAASPVSGSVSNKATMAGGTAGASAGATTDNTLHEVTTPDGKKVLVRGTQVSNPQPAPDPAIYQQEMADAKQRLAKGDPRAQGDIDALTREMKRIGIPQGQSTSDRVTQEATAKMMTELPMQLQQSKQTVAGLENAYRTIDQVSKSGPGVSRTVNALGIVNNLGIPLMKDDTNGYQTLKKFLENSASTAAASNGFTGSDARFEQFKAGQPNAETMNPDALKGAIRYVLSQHDASIARAQFIMQNAKQNAGDPNAVQNAQQQWSQVYNPRVFEFSRMDPADRARMKASMPVSQRQQFGAQYNAAHQMGWVQ